MKNPITAIVLALLTACAASENDMVRHETHERQHAQQDLRNQYARYTTPELNVMRDNLRHMLLGGSTTQVNLDPVATRIWGTSADHQLEELNRMERELLRRFTAGDKQADIRPKP